MSLNRQRSSLVPKEAVRSLDFQGLVSSMRSAITRIGKVGNGVALGTLLAISACQPDPQEKCKDKTCDVSNPDDNGTPTDTTDTTDNNTDPTCPPDCPEVPDTTPPAKPIMGLSGTQEVGPSTPSVLNTGTVDGSDTNKVEYSIDNGATWIQVPAYIANSNTFTDSVNANETRIWRAIDKAGNISPESDPFAVVEDALAPAKPIIANPDVMIFGPNDPTQTTITGTLPQAAETFDVEYRITDKLGNAGDWTDMPHYAPGDTTFYTSVPVTDSTFEVLAKDEWANASATDSTRMEGDFLPPEGGELPVTSFSLAATDTSFNIPGTYSTDTKTVKVLGPDGSERATHTINDNNYTFDLPATTTTGEAGIFSVQVIDVRGNARILGTVNVERIPAPTISNLTVDCSGGYWPGHCLAGGFPYPLSFDVNNGDTWSITVARTSGNGTVGSVDPASGTVTGTTINTNYISGGNTGDINEISVTVIGKGGSKTISLPVNLE